MSYFKKKEKRREKKETYHGSLEVQINPRGRILAKFAMHQMILFSQEYYKVICYVHLLILFLILSLRFLTQEAITLHRVRSYHVTLNVDLG